MKRRLQNPSDGLIPDEEECLIEAAINNDEYEDVFDFEASKKQIEAAAKRYLRQASKAGLH